MSGGGGGGGGSSSATGNAVEIIVNCDGTITRRHPNFEDSWEKPTKRGVVKVGPWGELKPQNLRDIDGNPTQLTEIRIRYSGCVESIKFKYVADGVAKWSSTWGSESGQTAEINLGTNHYLTAISGYYGTFHGNEGNYIGYTVIRSLTFESTRGTHGPYGPEVGTAFSLPVKAGKVVAFFGRAGQWLDALGFYLKPT